MPPSQTVPAGLIVDHIIIPSTHLPLSHHGHVHAQHRGGTSPLVRPLSHSLCFGKLGLPHKRQAINRCANIHAPHNPTPKSARETQQLAASFAHAWAVAASTQYTHQWDGRMQSCSRGAAAHCLGALPPACLPARSYLSVIVRCHQRHQRGGHRSINALAPSPTSACTHRSLPAWHAHGLATHAPRAASNVARRETASTHNGSLASQDCPPPPRLLSTGACRRWPVGHMRLTAAKRYIAIPTYLYIDAAAASVNRRLTGSCWCQGKEHQLQGRAAVCLQALEEHTLNVCLVMSVCVLGGGTPMQCCPICLPPATRYPPTLGKHRSVCVDACTYGALLVALQRAALAHSAAPQRPPTCATASGTGPPAAVQSGARRTWGWPACAAAAWRAARPGPAAPGKQPCSELVLLRFLPDCSGQTRARHLPRYTHEMHTGICSHGTHLQAQALMPTATSIEWVSGASASPSLTHPATIH